MQQDFTLLHAARKVLCSKHQEPISLICIADKCQTDRLFCMECFDGDQSTNHVMINVKKFNELYQKFKKLGGSDSQEKIKKQMTAFRVKANAMIDEIEKNALASLNSEVLLSNGQEQQIKGKLINIVNKPIWRKVLKYKKENKSEAEIQQMIIKSQQIGIKQLFNELQVIMKNVQYKLKDGIQILSFKNQGSKIISSKIKEIQENLHCFSNQFKHPKIQYSEGRTVAKGANEQGHYFTLAQDALTAQKPSRDFIIRSYGPFDSASLWIGVTHKTIAKANKFQNIYQQGKGSDFMVLYDGGKSINSWSHFSLNAVKSVTGKSINAGMRARVQVSYRTNTIKLYLGTNQKDMVLFDQHKARAVQGLYAAVGFYGPGQIEYV